MKYALTQLGQDAKGTDDIGQLMLVLETPCTFDEISAAFQETEECEFATPDTKDQHRAIAQNLQVRLNAGVLSGLIKCIVRG